MSEQVLYVQYIAVLNEGGLLMSFVVRRSDQQMAQATDRYSVQQMRQQDLSQLRFGPEQQQLQVEDEVCPLVHAVAGRTIAGPPVRYAANGHTACYIVRGTPLAYDVVLQRSHP